MLFVQESLFIISNANNVLASGLGQLTSLDILYTKVSNEQLTPLVNSNKATLALFLREAPCAHACLYTIQNLLATSKLQYGRTAAAVGRTLTLFLQDKVRRLY